MRILFITATRIGDAVLSTGLLDHLLRAHPAARFTVACGPAAEGVFARMPRRDAVPLRATSRSARLAASAATRARNSGVYTSCGSTRRAAARA